jgi:hypothetical protein
MEMKHDLWGEVSLDTGATAVRRLGALSLELRREPGGEVWVRGSHDDGGGALDGEWIRWAVAPGDRLELRPSLPDRSIVVSPEHPFFLPPRGRARVFVRVPLFVRVNSIDQKGEATVLEEFPTIVLSDTWWGGFTEGELAYWVHTRARRAASPEGFEPHYAVCPFELVNESLYALPVERFAVRVAYLTLFGRDAAVWTDEILVRYEGPEEGSRISYTGRVPDDAGDVERIVEPRELAPKGLHSRTFSRLRAFSVGS